MAAVRLPGILCVVTNALPIDAGTLVRGNTPTAGTVRGDAGPVSLSDDDRALLKNVGKDMSGTVFPLESLIQSNERHLRLHKEAVGQFGARSGAALFEEAILDRLAELIAEARSPRGRAAEKLRDVLKRLKGSDSPVSEKEASQAIRDLLTAEGQMDEASKGLPDSSGRTALQLIDETLQEVSRSKKAEFKELIAKAKRAGNMVTDVELNKAAADMMGVERQRQMLGLPDDHFAGASAMDLLSEALEFSHERRKTILKDLIEKAQRSGNAVDKNQIRKAVTNLMETERQRQLMGLSDSGTSSPTTSELLDQASKILESSAA